MNFIKLNFGPQHPAAHGVLRLILTLKNEKIIFADPHIGLLHRGTEKLIETKTINQALPYFDRLDYVSMMAQEHTFSLCIEEFLQLKITNKLKYIRIIFLEITRILNHLLAIACHALDVGALTPFLWAFEEREKLMEFYERASGGRMHANYIRPGLLLYEISFSLLSDILIFCFEFENRLLELEEILNNNRIWFIRLYNIGTITQKNAYTFGFSGVMLRSTGTFWDLRKHLNYDNYNLLLFKIPVSFKGDCFDRFLLRLNEIKQSLIILIQIINILIKNFQKKEEKIKKKYLLKLGMENLIEHFKFFTENYILPKHFIYFSTEAPKGEFGIYLEGNLTPFLYRCKIKSPGFNHLQGLEILVKNQSLADLITIIGTVDIVFGEIDR